MSKHPCLSKIYDEINRFEIGIDEAGRGPLFGRLYVAATVLPKDNTFQHEKMRDSKTIKSRKNIQDLSQYIKTNAIAWHIQYVEASVIDTINIRQAVLLAMHECAKQVIAKISRRKEIKTQTLLEDAPGMEYVSEKAPDEFLQLYKNTTHMNENNISRIIPGIGVREDNVDDSSQNDTTDDCMYEREYMLLVDGNDFTPHMIFDEITQTMKEIPHETIEGGDNKYTCIAAASILAKNERDTYIEELCKTYPVLNERYGLAKNMGYGTKQHRDGIEEHGITQWHRKTYGLCKTAKWGGV